MVWRQPKVLAVGQQVLLDHVSQMRPWPIGNHQYQRNSAKLQGSEFQTEGSHILLRFGYNRIQF